MVYREHNGLIVVRLDNGEKFPETISKLFDEIPYMESGVVVSALGMLNEFELGYFHEGQYVIDRFDTPMELLSINGSIARNAEPWYHMHAVLGKKDKSTVGGHLFGGTVWGTLELFVLASDVRLGRIQKGPLKVLDIM